MAWINRALNWRYETGDHQQSGRIRAHSFHHLIPSIATTIAAARYENGTMLRIQQKRSISPNQGIVSDRKDANPQREDPRPGLCG